LYFSSIEGTVAGMAGNKSAVLARFLVRFGEVVVCCFDGRRARARGRMIFVTSGNCSLICAENQYCSSIKVDRLPPERIMELYNGMSLQTLW
jgi:hypothetical protein